MKEKISTKPNIQVVICVDLEEISDAAVNNFCKIHDKSINRFYIIPGGLTPSLFFSKLALKIKDWSNTKFLLSDERLIDETSKWSNTRQVKEKLIDQTNTNNKPLLVPIYQEGLDPEEMQIAMAKTTIKLLKEGPPELAILGLGSDGHTASLFPQNPNIFSESTMNNILLKKTNEEFHRISLTFHVLLKAKRMIFLVKGIEKAYALKESLAGDYNPKKFPTQYIFKHYSHNIHIYCDKMAAKYL